MMMSSMNDFYPQVKKEVFISGMRGQNYKDNDLKIAKSLLQLTCFTVM